MAEPEAQSSAGTPDAVPQGAAAQCPWCATPAAADADRCTSCGAALAQRETIGELLIPGVTSVDPALQDYDKRPLHITGPSPSQGMAPALIVGAMAGGPAGLAAIGGVAAVAAVEYLGTGRGAGSANLQDVGRPSEVVLQALGRMEDGTIDRAGQVASTESRSSNRPLNDSAAADNRRSIWRDLPAADQSDTHTQEEAIDGDG